MAIKSLMVCYEQYFNLPESSSYSTDYKSSTPLGAPDQTATSKSAALLRILISVAIEFEWSFVIILRHYWENVWSFSLIR